MASFRRTPLDMRMTSEAWDSMVNQAPPKASQGITLPAPQIRSSHRPSSDDRSNVSSERPQAPAPRRPADRGSSSVNTGNRRPDIRESTSGERIPPSPYTGVSLDQLGPAPPRAHASHSYGGVKTTVTTSTRHTSRTTDGKVGHDDYTAGLLGVRDVDLDYGKNLQGVHEPNGLTRRYGN